MSSTDLVAVVRVQFNDEWIVRFHVRSLTLLILPSFLLFFPARLLTDLTFNDCAGSVATRLTK